ncbi:hypothetical protein [Cryptosporangium sp. NPDC051539]|uniref:restriction endonuclease-related protein n=1 Tax=Cryptosporangium sp. NPDC051539 TaxID=3363962 RepID=UPI0037A4278E
MTSVRESAQRVALSEAERVRRDQSITACCLAAAAMSDESLSAGRRGKLLMDCLGVLSAARRADEPLSMTDFRQRLSGPLRLLLPGDLAAGHLSDLVLLDESGQLLDETIDVAVEHLVPRAALDEHWSWARVSAEQEERRTYGILRRLPAKEYARVRGLLIKHPSGELTRLRRVWDGLLSQLDLYESVSTRTWCQVRGHWFACPRCRWPMRVSGSGAVRAVRCEAHAREGVIYTCNAERNPERAPKVEPAGSAATPVRATPATADHLALSRTTWRYVTLPGLLEWNLRDHARSLGARVVMWPHKDRYDVKITLNKRSWKVDAKAWASVTKLGDALKDTEPPEPGLIIVIPDHQANGRELLQKMIGRSGYRVLTASGLKAELDAAKAGQR